MYWYIILGISSGYLLGSIPFGYLLARLWKKIDIRQYGSGNIGATNIWRTLGPLPGVMVLLADMAKGALAVILARQLASGDMLVATELAAAAGALMGHGASIFLRFKGGKIVATGAGIIFILSPLTGLIGLVLFIITVSVTRYVSAGSIVAALTVPVCFYLFQLHTTYLTFAILVAGYALFKHRSNIKRIILGTEYKIGEKPK